MAETIIRGVPNNYQAPSQAPEPATGISVGATPANGSPLDRRSLRTSDWTTQDLLLSIDELLRHIRWELMFINNTQSNPTTQMDWERNDTDALYNDPRGFYSNAANKSR